MPPSFWFEILGQDASSGLRAGLFHTPHGPIPTPGFMPVGTVATVKALPPADVRATGAACVLANTYHLALRPGPELIQQLGGLHAFMRWDGPILTDSGGFQVFSLASLRAVDDEGVSFASHLDGSPLHLTPERVIAVEEALGADIIMPLDECVGPGATRPQVEQALDRTQKWWTRSLSARTRDDQALFALIQGGLFPDLRAQAARTAAAEPAPGFALGGFSLGEPPTRTAAVLQDTLAALPPQRVRYLMGVGAPQDLLTYAGLGIDLFDCVLPTRLARNGAVWLNEQGERANLADRRLLAVTEPLTDWCPCPACRQWSLGALAARYQAGDTLVLRLASRHNLTLLASALARLRASVLPLPA